MTLSKNHIKQPNLLVVEDDPSLREALVDTLELESMRVQQAASAEAAMSILLKNSEFDLVISDVNMGAMSGHDLLRQIKSDMPHIPVLLITAFASIQESVTAMREGAVDYLVKPFEPEVLVETVKKFVAFEKLKSDEPIAVSQSSKDLLQLAKRVAQSDSTCLLMGESGTGKEVLAQYIHANSNRSDKPFVAINCAAIPENMLEAILFGYEKGAYTGAQASSPGKFEQANGGTILLDEISEMDLGLQAKLLRVLQEREVERLGGRKSIQLDVRIIATSNRDMRREVSVGKFREDLYFRLSVLPLQWAPLRDRKQDIVPLATSLLSKHAKKQSRPKVTLSDGAKNALFNYLWPGNVRELDNVMQRALILQTGHVINEQDLGLNIGDHFSKKPSLVDATHDLSSSQDSVSHIARENGQNTFVEPVSRQENDVGGVSNDSSFGSTNQSYTGCDNGSILIEDQLASQLGSGLENHAQNNEVPASGPLLGSDMKKHEFEIIVKTLKQENGSKKNTAKKLGISPRTLRYKIARLRDEGYDLEASMIA